MAICYLGLGSNLGNREEYIKNAVAEFKNAGVITHKISSIIETQPEGGPQQGDYLNAVAKVETSLTPQELLQLSQTIEKKLGRKRTVLNGPRTIDIDLLLYDPLTVNSPELTIPHPRMFTRRFVMIPLMEIAPELVKEFAHANYSQP